jgi:hypothetical protein
MQLTARLTGQTPTYKAVLPCASWQYHMKAQPYKCVTVVRLYSTTQRNTCHEVYANTLVHAHAQLEKRNHSALVACIAQRRSLVQERSAPSAPVQQFGLVLETGCR